MSVKTNIYTETSVGLRQWIPELLVVGFLAEIVAVLTLQAIFTDLPLTGLLIHSVLLAAFASICTLHYQQKIRLSGTTRGALLFGFIFFLYGSLGQIVFDAIPWLADQLLANLDQALPVPSPLLVASSLTESLWATEVLSLAYLSFLPLLIWCVWRGVRDTDATRRQGFLAAFSCLYITSFFGYLFMPAYGPIVAMAELYPQSINGGYFHKLVEWSITLAGGPHGAFPSLHLGAALLAMVFEWRYRNRRLAMTYLPLVALIAVATVALRYHYVVDLLAAIALVCFAVYLAHRAAPGLKRHERSNSGLIVQLLNLSLTIFFRNIKFSEQERIPVSGPVLLISNHSNALVDPLLLARATRRPLTLTAKSSLQRNPLLALVFRSFDVIFLHRKQDVIPNSERQSNHFALACIASRLHAGRMVCLFPEGKSHSEKTLQRFHTGAARAALSAIQSEGNDDNSDIIILPAGIHYNDKSRWRSDVYVHFGQPQSLQHWMENNPGAGARQLTASCEQWVAHCCDTQHPLPDHEPDADRVNQSIWSLPIAVWGCLNLGPTVWLIRKLVNQLSSDHDHPATYAVLMGPAVFVLMLALQIAALATFLTPLWLAVYLVSLPVSAYAALRMVDHHVSPAA